MPDDDEHHVYARAAAFKTELEKQERPTTDRTATIQVFRIVTKASAQVIWDALTKPEWTARYAFGGRVEYD